MEIPDEIVREASGFCVIGKAYISSACSIPLICPVGLFPVPSFNCVFVEPFAAGTSGSPSSWDFTSGISGLSVMSL